MGMAPEKFLAYLIAMAFMLVIANGVYISERSALTTDDINLQLSVAVGDLFGKGELITNEGEYVQPEGYQQEGSVGNAVRMGGIIMKIIYQGLNPFAFFGDTESNAEVVIMSGLAIFQAMIIALICLQVYLIFKNKKV